MKKSIFLFFAAILCAMTANAACYLKGGFNDWSTANEMAVSGTTATCTIDLPGLTTYEFKIDNGTWYGINNATFTATSTKTLSSSAGNAKITTKIPGAYTFSFNTSTKKLTVTYPTVPALHDITVRAKVPAHWTNDIYAHVWTSENASGSDVGPLTKEGDYYVVTKNAGALYVIFKNGSAWSDKNQTVDLCYTEDVCLQLNQSGSAKGTATVIDCGAVAKDITVKAVVPGAWENTITAWVWPTGGEGKEVTPTKDGNWYVVTENCIELNVIFKNGTGWNGNENQTANITGVSENTCYQISALNKDGEGKCTYTVVDCEAAIEPEAKPVDVYTIVGAETLVGTAWDLNNTDNDMTKQGDGSYVLVKENVELATTGTYEYKVAKNRSWDWKGVNGGNNLTLTGVDVDGTYNVTFTLNKELNALTASLELVEAKKVIPECYVAGDESLTGQNWDAKSVLMTYDEATEVYTATLTAVPAGTHNMKVVYGGEWLGFDHLATPAPANVKEGEDKKIQFTLAEAGDVTVTYHATNGIGLTGNFAVPAPKYYIAGTQNLTGFDWKENGLEIAKEGDVYKHTFSELGAGIYEFKITDGTWTNPWGYSNLGAAYEEVSEGTDGEGNPNGNIKFVTEEAKNITVIFDPAENLITIDGLTEKVPVEKHYYLIGTFNEWTLADANYELALVDGLYKKEVTLAKDVEFKINDGADAWWGKDNLDGKTYSELDYTDDGNIKMKEEKTFTVIFDPANNLITFEDLTVVEDYYTIVGATAITGVDWDPANEDNKMTKEGEVYTLTKNGLKLEAGDYGYKVAKNGAWGDGEYPNGTNEKVTIAENGVYTIVYTYTVGTSLTAVPEKTGDYTPEKPVYTVAGDAALCGTNWKADDTDNDMFDNGDGTFTWEKTGVKLTGDAGFKVVKNHDFGTAYPAENWVIKIADHDGAAIYTVTITFTESSKDIAVTLTKTGDAAPAVISYVLMGVNGDWDNGIALTQNPGNADEYVLENQVIIKATDAVKVVTLTDGTATAWCGNVDTYSNAKYTADAEGNIVLEDGIYTFYFKKNDNLIYINQTGYVRNVTNKYGTICLPYASVSTSGAIFYRVAGKEEGKVYLESVDALEAGVPYIFEKTANQIKVVYTGDKETTAGKANGLYGTFTDETPVAAGNYILLNNELRPSDGSAKVNANRAYIVMNEVPVGAPQQMPGRRYIGMSVQGENEATGLDNITNGENTTIKLIENGQLIIIRNGEKFNAQGVRL